MGKIDYIEAFRARATQLNARTTGREWVEAGVPLDDAIAWADLGYLPTEAAPLIAAGQTPADIATLNDAMSTGDRHADALAAIQLLTGDTADEDEVRRALASADARHTTATTPWGTPPDMPAAELAAITPGRRAEILAALNAGDTPAEVVWAGIHGGQALARLADGTDVHLIVGQGWTGV